MRRLRNWHLHLALVVLTVAAFGPLWGNGFVDMDDEVYITKNPSVLGGWTGSGFRWAWTTFYGSYWQPLSWLSLQGDAQLFSTPSPAGHPVPSAAAVHGQNLLWHLASVLLLFAVWRRLTGALWRSFLVAALFAVHPLRVESVAWAAERKDVLSCFFGILTLWAYVRYAEKPGWPRYLGVAGAFLLSLLCKPMLMTLPFVFLLLDYWPLCRTSFGPDPGDPAPRSPVSLGQLLLEKVPLFALTAGIMSVTLLARAQTGEGIPYDVLPLSDRLATAATAYGWYVAHTFYPLGLAALYPHPYHNWSVAGALAGTGTLLALTLLCWRQARRRPWLITGWLWFVGALVPVSGLALAGDQSWADRFTYWPHIGLLVATAWGLGEVVDRWRVPAVVPGAAGALTLGVLAAFTWVQVGYWRDASTLWERALAVTEDNFRAHVGMGNYYGGRGQLDLATAHLTESIRIRPDAPAYRFALGGVLHQLNREEEAAEQFQEAVRLAPDFYISWHNLGLIRLKQGRTAEAARYFRQVLNLEPTSAVALAGLGGALWQEGKRPEAVQTFQAALGRDPGLAAAWHGLGVAYLAQGDPDKALEALERALRLQPHSIDACSDLGVALGRTGRWADAARCQFQAVQLQGQLDRYLQTMNGRPAVCGSDRQLVLYECRLGFALRHCGNPTDAGRAYREALRCDPEWPRKFTAKARALATAPDANCRDPHLAYELASQAVAAVGDPPAEMRDALAAARAALGKGPNAGATAP